MAGVHESSPDSRRIRWPIAMLAALLLGATAPGLPGPTPSEVAAYARSGASYRARSIEPIIGWEKALVAALRDGGSIDAASKALAPAHDMSPEAMAALVRLWVVLRVRGGAINADPGLAAEARRELLALLRAHRTPLVVEAVADRLDAIEDCSSADFDAMLEGAADRAGDAWRIALTAPCTGHFLDFMRAAPDRAAAALIPIADLSNLSPHEAVPIFTWLTSPEGFARVAPEDRERLMPILVGKRLRALFEGGLDARAIEVAEAIPPELRARVFDTKFERIVVTIDGLPVPVDTGGYHRPGAIEVAAAYALEGRTADAERWFAMDSDIEAARAELTCRWPPAGGDRFARCPNSGNSTGDLLVLDALLHHPADDPYPLAEVMFGVEARNTPPVLEKLRCRLFDPQRFGAICNGTEIALRPYSIWDQDAAAKADLIARGIAAAGLPGFAAVRAPSDEAFAGADTPAPAEARGGAASVLTLPFDGIVESALPAGFSRTRPPFNGWPAGMTPLGDDFFPIRVEADGDHVVAISISQRFDWGRDRSRGAYWLHLSEDGGRHWRSHYTGIVDHGPYAIYSTSKLPMIHGDRLELEAEYAPADPRPWSTRSRLRIPSLRRVDLKISVPLAPILRDSDGDGLNDPAAHRLGLDLPPGSPEAPLVLTRSRPESCSGPPTAEEQVLTAMIATQAGAHRGTIDDPILIEGRRASFACVTSDRRVLVYGPGPDSPLSDRLPTNRVSRITFDRGQDRGYFHWGEGTYLAIRVEGSWKIEVISIPLI